MPGEIRSLEIFGVGTWDASTGRVIVTETDLDGIVESFYGLQGSNIVKPHLKLGHSDAQKWFGQKDGIPTLGWISRIWRNGKKLFADIVDVPDMLMDLIRAGRYHNVSSEVYLNASFEHNGRKWGKVLSAVALLGVEMPAVKDLAGIANALFTAERQPTLRTEGADLTVIDQENEMPGDPKLPLFSQEQMDALIKAAVDKAVVEVVAKQDKTVQDLTAERNALTVRAESAEKEVKAVKATAAVAEATMIVDQAIKDGKLLPKHKAMAMAFMSNTGAIKFGEGEKSTAVLFKELLESLGSQVALKEKGDGKTAQGSYATAAEEVDAKTKAAIKDNSKLSYGDAMQQVLAADPDLKGRYALSTQ